MTAPYWPIVMKRATAAAYCDMSVASFEKEVALGRLPGPFVIGGLRHWSRKDIDQHIDLLAGGVDNWEAAVPMYAKR